MIKFEKITIKNFMSVGNASLTVDYTAAKSTIVTAVNGSGKSSIMLDSICFVLYGKPYRPINKPQLLNSINQKGLLVEIEFKIDKTRYKVKRGIKPNIFEIYKGGKLINQDAAARDYQKVLEQTILKMNFRTFTQIVIMGSGNYIPFMRLKPDARREFIEDILDIKIFSTMNMLLKQQVKEHFEHLKEITTNINFLKEKIKIQHSFIEKMEDEKTNQKASIVSEIERLTTEIDDLWKTISSLQENVESIQLDIDGHNMISDKKIELQTLAKQIKANIVKFNKDKEFYSNTEICPTCHQEIEEHHREKIIARATNKVTEFGRGLAEIEARLIDFNSQLEIISEKQRKISELQSRISECNSSINTANTMISKYHTDLSTISTDTGSIDSEKAKLKKTSKELMTLVDEKRTMKDTETYFGVISGMLKDTGIKTRIIKQYVPVFNKLINKYLQQLDMFVEFQLDENFSETVKSRYRDTFTYDSFSEGEKQRIDLALMFVFREVARLKNAINTNLLIMDEVLDASMDATGVDNFFNIINSLSTTNLFVISHRQGMADKFDAGIKLIKKGNFTVVDNN